MAEDRFEIYYAEKLWEMIPAFYRHEDGLGDPPGVLRSLVEVLATQAAVLRRSHDRLWDDQFADLADDWAIPYLGDLLGTRLVSALNPRGRRVDVAKTLYYRRRKGTLAVLEELVSDIAGWDGTMVEGFSRLARARHRLDPPVGAGSALAGLFSGTPPGGIADLRRPRVAELADGPFDELHHTPDMRRPRGREGRYAISRLVFHLFRIPAMPLRGVTPRLMDGTLGFSFDPSGRDVPLFAPRGRAVATEGWHRAREWELASPISCRLLGHAELEIGEAVILAVADDHGLSTGEMNELRGRRGICFPSEARFRRSLAGLPSAATFLDPPVYRDLFAGSLVEDCGKAALLVGKIGSSPAIEVEASPGNAVPGERIAAGNLFTWDATATGKRAVVDPVRGRLLFLGAAPAVGSRVAYHYGFPGEIGAGGFDRRQAESTAPDESHSGGGALPAAGIANPGLTQIEDSATYGPPADKAGVQSVIVRAADQQRPYLELAGSWVLDTSAHEDSELTLEGLWLGTQGAETAVVLRGDYERVILRHVTLDPGGARGLDGGGGALAAVGLRVEGHVEELLLDACVCGPVTTAGDGVIERLEIRDSVIQSLDEAQRALAVPGTELEMTRVTVLGGVSALRLWASEVLITGDARVTDNQAGCFRFSAALAGSRLPQRYQSHLLADFRSVFTSRRFGDPAYVQLSQLAPEALARGAENGSEIGAWAGLVNPIKLDSLRAKVEEFSPFGRIPVFLLET